MKHAQQGEFMALLLKYKLKLSFLFVRKKVKLSFLQFFYTFIVDNHCQKIRYFLSRLVKFFLHSKIAVSNFTVIYYSHVSKANEGVTILDA